MVQNLPEGVHFIVPTEEKLSELWARFTASHGIFDDITKGDVAAFLRAIHDYHNVWLELDDGGGVLYATNVIPGLSADVHIAFWDHKIRPRYSLIVKCLNWLTNVCELEKINASLPDFAHVARKHVVALGFQQEGLIRRFSRSDGKLYDLYYYGILKEGVLTHPLKEI